MLRELAPVSMKSEFYQAVRLGLGTVGEHAGSPLPGGQLNYVVLAQAASVRPLEPPEA